MILVDFNGTVVGNLLHQKEFDTDLMRHQVLNTLRMYNHKFRKEYGRMIICLEGRSWRKDYFPEYKASRKIKRDENKERHDQIFEFIAKLTDDIRIHFPYQVIRTNGAEADDVIATLVHNTQEFGQYEPVMIVSGDKDFVQLQKYKNVKQYSPITKKFLVEKDPDRFIKEHILTGDSTDGVPNILSPDDIFLRDGERQTPLRKTRKDEILSAENIKDVLTEEEYRNYIRNKTCIDLDQIPEEIQKRILDDYNAEWRKSSKMETMNYLMKHKCKLLVGAVDEFF